MKTLFIGWNENGERCLQALLDRKYTFEQLVIPTGYDTQKMREIADKNNIPVYEYKNDLDQLEKLITTINPDLILVASFPKLLPNSILGLPKFGVINVHTGELPKYRGFHPLNWAIIRDEARIGVTVHYMDEGMDTGDILAQGTVAVTNHDDILTIKDKATTLGASLLADVMEQVAKSKTKLVGVQQRDSQVLFAPMRRPHDSAIKWTNTSRDVFNVVRALKAPYPNAYGLAPDGQKVEFEESYMPNQAGVVIGKVKGYYLVTTGDGVIMLKTKHNLGVGTQLQ